MVERIKNEGDLRDYIQERQHTLRLREAIGFCKGALEVTATTDHKLNAEQRVQFERCLTENFLLKRGQDYFGKRDLIYVDLYGLEDAQALNSTTA